MMSKPLTSGILISVITRSNFSASRRALPPGPSVATTACPSALRIWPKLRHNDSSSSQRSILAMSDRYQIAHDEVAVLVQPQAAGHVVAVVTPEEEPVFLQRAGEQGALGLDGAGGVEVVGHDPGELGVD